MDKRDIKTLRKHGFKAATTLPKRQVTTSLTFESENRVYLWVTERSGSQVSGK